MYTSNAAVGMWSSLHK